MITAAAILAIAGIVGAAASAASAGANWYYGSKSNDLQREQLGLQGEQLDLQREQQALQEAEYNESLRSNYYTYMQNLTSMEGQYSQNQLAINQERENIASNQNYLDRWASEYDQSMQSTVDDAYSTYQSLASNYSAGLVTSAEKGHKGGSSARVNQDNALSLKSLVGTTNGFTLKNNRLGAYVQSTALDMMADKQTALSSVNLGYQSIDSYKDAMKSLSESITSMKNSTSEMKETLLEKGLTV